MKKKLIAVFALLLFCENQVKADELPKDSIKVIDIEEVVVIATPKENRKLREQPVSSTLISQEAMQTYQINNLKGLSGIVPNLFVPDYGSKLTSSIYIRGIGSRINTPVLGLYVDNVPYIDKSAFDFNYYDIERIDVLRGPQGTLYGRNTMAGLIKVHTKSPFTYQGTDVKLSAGTRNAYNASATHYHRISNSFAFSAGGFYGYSGGAFTNSFNGKKTDRLNETGGRVRAIYLPAPNLKLDFSVGYEYSDQNGYPYFYTGRVNGVAEEREEHIGHISTDQKSSYTRNLLNSGLNIEYQDKKFILSAVTGYQYLKDRMLLDNDFTEKDIFTLEQKQRQHALSEEVVIKSKANSKWQWTNGLFGVYQWLKTDAPVTFSQNGIKELIEDNANANFPTSPTAPSMSIIIHNPSLYISDKFNTPTINTAFYHQSTINNLFFKGFSATVGVRFDYERIKMKYNCASTPLDFTFSMQMPGAPVAFTDRMEAASLLYGHASHDYWQVLPKFALQYEWKNNNIYASAARGYRSGGYNVQMFSDLVQLQTRNGMKTAMMESSVFSKYAAIIESMMPTYDIDPKAASLYKPEYTWSYELGSHLTLWKNRLQIDLSTFYMDTKDQQVSRFVNSGAGRITLNAGRSRSFGAEVAANTYLTEALRLNMVYGYTNSKFKEYATNTAASIEENNIDYKGNYVPFVPMHTFNIGGSYLFTLSPTSLFDHIEVSTHYNGVARIYWTEQNNVRQPFYGTLNARAAFKKKNAEIALWGRNLFDKKYTAFYFESMNNGFMQKGNPVQLGVEVRCRF